MTVFDMPPQVQALHAARMAKMLPRRPGSDMASVKWLATHNAVGVPCGAGDVTNEWIDTMLRTFQGRNERLVAVALGGEILNADGTPNDPHIAKCYSCDIDGVTQLEKDWFSFESVLMPERSATPAIISTHRGFFVLIGERPYLDECLDGGVHGTRMAFFDEAFCEPDSSGSAENNEFRYVYEYYREAENALLQ